MTVRFLPSNRTRLLCELGWRRPASSTTPALTSSSLNFWYSAIASGVGGVAASLCSLSFAIISTRISVSSLLQLSHRYGLGLLRPHLLIEWQAAFSTWGRGSDDCLGVVYAFTRSPDAPDLSVAAMTSWRRTTSAKSGTD